jgi:hypothetical protein
MEQEAGRGGGADGVRPEIIKSMVREYPIPTLWIHEVLHEIC